MTLGTMARLGIIVLVARLLLDVGTPLAPGAFELARMGIEGAGAPHQRADSALAAPRHENPRVAAAADSMLIDTSPRIARRPIAPPRRSSHRPLRQPSPGVVAVSGESPAAH